MEDHGPLDSCRTRSGLGRAIAGSSDGGLHSWPSSGPKILMASLWSLLPVVAACTTLAIGLLRCCRPRIIRHPDLHRRSTPNNAPQSNGGRHRPRTSEPVSARLLYLFCYSIGCITCDSELVAPKRSCADTCAAEEFHGYSRGGRRPCCAHWIWMASVARRIFYSIPRSLSRPSALHGSRPVSTDSAYVAPASRPSGIDADMDHAGDRTDCHAQPQE